MNTEAEKSSRDSGDAPAEGRGIFSVRPGSARTLPGAGPPAGHLLPAHARGFSALHQLKTTNLWHFHAGDLSQHLQLDPRDGSFRVTLLGPDVSASQQPQLMVPRDVWQGRGLALSPLKGWPRARPRPAGGPCWAVRMAPAWDETEFRWAVARTGPGLSRPAD